MNLFKTVSSQPGTFDDYIASLINSQLADGVFNFPSAKPSSIKTKVSYIFQRATANGLAVLSSGKRAVLLDPSTCRPDTFKFKFVFALKTHGVGFFVADSKAFGRCKFKLEFEERRVYFRIHEWLKGDPLDLKTPSQRISLNDSVALLIKSKLQDGVFDMSFVTSCALDRSLTINVSSILRKLIVGGEMGLRSGERVVLFDSIKHRPGTLRSELVLGFKTHGVGFFVTNSRLFGKCKFKLEFEEYRVYFRLHDHLELDSLDKGESYLSRARLMVKAHFKDGTYFLQTAASSTQYQVDAKPIADLVARALMRYRESLEEGGWCLLHRFESEFPSNFEQGFFMTLEEEAVQFIACNSKVFGVCRIELNVQEDELFFRLDSSLEPVPKLLHGDSKIRAVVNDLREGDVLYFRRGVSSSCGERYLRSRRIAFLNFVSPIADRLRSGERAVVSDVPKLLMSLFYAMRDLGVSVIQFKDPLYSMYRFTISCEEGGVAVQSCEDVFSRTDRAMDTSAGPVDEDSDARVQDCKFDTQDQVEQCIRDKLIGVTLVLDGDHTSGLTQFYSENTLRIIRRFFQDALSSHLSEVMSSEKFVVCDFEPGCREGLDDVHYHLLMSLHNFSIPDITVFFGDYAKRCNVFFEEGKFLLQPVPYYRMVAHG